MSTTTAPVTVYATDTCPWCDRTIDFLRKHDVPHVVKNVQHDQNAAMEMVRRSGQQGVPVVATADEVIVGFDQVRLKRIADRLSKPKRPALGLLAADAESYLAKHPDRADGYPVGLKGVFVGEVRADSVAAKAGLQPGDVVQSVAGKRVRNMVALDQIVETLEAGEKVSVRYHRPSGEGEGETILQF